MTDIEISRNSNKRNIVEVAKSVGIDSDDLILYGNYKAKITTPIKENPNSKLVLVTAISPTPMGEGKTTVSIGLGDALHQLKKSVVIALREPSMGPVFGMKGGATGGGYSQVVPMEDINLHFTGDFHAITSANDLLCAAIDNHIYFGNALDIQDVYFHRCLDVNDRALRSVDLGTRKESFSITAASEIMALFCLASDLEDLKRRLGNIIIGTNSKGEFIYARDLNVQGSMVTLLRDAFRPNLVQTLEGTPAIIHGGPFANIAHGCNTVVATKTGLGLADYVVTEAGFGADLGAEKFLDIKCRKAGISPDTIVLVATIKALKYHGGVPKDQVFEKNDEALKKGLENLERHAKNLNGYGVNVIVCLNKFTTDTEEEIKIVEKFVKDMGMEFSLSTAYVDGGKGAEDLAHKVVESCDKNKKKDFHFLYQDDMPVVEKIKKVCYEIYHAGDVHFSDIAKEKIALFEKGGFGNYPVCIAKTQYSFSDNQKLVGAPVDFTIEVKDVNLFNGAEFITVYLGDIMTMPGLSKKPSYEKIDIVDGDIVGLS